jgi:serine/threonine protein kinase
VVPVSVEDFLDLVRKSGVVEEERLAAYVERARKRAQLPAQPDQLAEAMFADGLLTRFQVRAFLRGKWRGFRLGHYKVLERLGSGEMSNVFLCQHVDMRRRVAVKVLTHVGAADPTGLKRFYREARAAASLEHRNIVRAHDVDHDQNLHFLVMDYVDGVSFEELIVRHGPLPWLRAAHYIRQAAEGLHHAHQAGLVHRDVKPSNLMLDRQGVVKLLDLGVARLDRADEDVLTQQVVLGTAEFLAPEQAVDSHQVDHRADVYSLGATFCYLLTGSPRANEYLTPEKLLARQTWHREHLPPDVPEGLKEIIARMMARAPEDRYATAADVADALADWTRQPIPPPRADEMPRLSAAAMGRSPTVSQLLLPEEPVAMPAVDRAAEAAPVQTGPPARRHLRQWTDRVWWGLVNLAAMGATAATFAGTLARGLTGGSLAP